MEMNEMEMNEMEGNNFGEYVLKKARLLANE